MDEYLKLNNETVLADSKARENIDKLFVYVEDKTVDFISAFQLLSVPDNVQKIIYHYYKAELVFEGFTKLISLQDDGNRIIAILKKDGAENGSN